MKKLITIILVLVAIGAGAGAYYMRRAGPEPQAMLLPVSRGDIVDVVAATGTLQAVTTVAVGTQVSGLVQDMYADFNSIVKQGQVIARLDPSLIQTQIEQQRANVIRSEADLERLRVSLADTERKYEQAKTMWEKQLIPRDQLETAEMNVKMTNAQIKSSEAGLTQARANLNQQEVNLRHTVIRSPIDGIVIQRSVDPGQTVASSMNAPTLYIIAADLTEMQVLANIDEADVGRMRPNQHVTFRVDAYPTETFTGTVEQVRLQPTVVQNVVVYSTVIDVPNPQLKLKPGMTANVSIEIARRSNVLRVPSAAIRFRPTEEMFAALNQPLPPELQRAGGRGAGAPGGNGRGRGRQPEGAPTSGQPAAGGSQQAPAGAGQGGAEARGGGDRAEGGRSGRGGFDPNMSPEERKRRMEERLASMSPEERERFQARMRDGLGGQRGTGDQGGGRRDISRGIAGGVSGGSAVASGATTIDALFAPLPPTESSGRVWLYVDKQLKSVSVRLGITDGTYSELLRGDLEEGQQVVVNFTTGLEQQPRPGQQGGSQNPLMGPQRGGRGPGGGGRGR
ncbi:MAG TPA: efflux RND transporter periplasmic adaptor subunit [Vicinamibacterales bacterium]|nr:efflux RND transporter periplasmic adaptor subunit [Vicinamibacterales bacterium]